MTFYLYYSPYLPYKSQSFYYIIERYVTRILKYEMRTKGFISVSFACVRHYNGIMRLVSKICAVSECFSVRRLDIERMLNCFATRTLLLRFYLRWIYFTSVVQTHFKQKQKSYNNKQDKMSIHLLDNYDMYVFVENNCKNIINTTL